MKKLSLPIIVIVMALISFFFVNADSKDNEKLIEINKSSVLPKTETIEVLEFDKDTNYATLMIEAACTGNIESGREYGRLRELKMEYLSRTDNFNFDDLYLLSKIVESEAGSDWLTEEHRQMVASVVINRVNSPEFPNTLYEVAYQRGQYAAVGTTKFNNMIPSKKSVNSAYEVLVNGSIAPNTVVFQAEFIQGSGTYKVITDSILGTTYFCYSNNKNLYN